MCRYGVGDTAKIIYYIFAFCEHLLKVKFATYSALGWMNTVTFNILLTLNTISADLC